MGRIATALFLGTLVLLPLGLLPVAPGVHPRLQWSDVLLAAAFPAWLLSGRLVARGRAVHLAYGVYLLSSGIAWIGAAAPDAVGAAKLVGIASLVALALMTTALTRDPRGAALAGRAVAVAATLASLAALAGTLLYYAGVVTPLVGPDGDLVAGEYPRARGVFLHPNGLASFSIAAAGLVASPRAALPRPLVRLLITLLFAAAAASLSRGVLGLAVALAIAQARSPARRALAVAVTTIALLAVAMLSLGHLELDPTRPGEAVWRDSLSPRRQALETASRAVRKHPMGIGPGALAARVDGVPFEAHCTPLNVAATLGLPAAVALLSLPLLLWRRRTRPADLAVWGALVGLGVDGLAQDIEDFRHLWLVLGWLGAEAENTSAGPALS